MSLNFYPTVLARIDSFFLVYWQVYEFQASISPEFKEYLKQIHNHRQNTAKPAVFPPSPTVAIRTIIYLIQRIRFDWTEVPKYREFANLTFEKVRAVDKLRDSSDSQFLKCVKKLYYILELHETTRNYTTFVSLPVFYDTCVFFLSKQRWGLDECGLG